MNLQKEELRRRLLQRRDAIPDREAKDTALFEALSRFPPYCQAEKLLFYVSVGSEAGTRLLLRQAWLENREVYLPRCLPDGELGFYRVRGWEELKTGRFGIPEPDPDRQPRPLPEDLTNAFCLVPGVAFDRRGFRIGYGKGYYDRFLAGKNIVCAGLCRRELVLERLPAEAHDQSVAYLAAEDGVVPCRDR